MIEVKNVRKEYIQGGNVFEALKGISVQINEGEIFGFIGLSGAGKTSLVRCIAALESVTSGEIRIDGIDFTKLTSKELREARKKMGLVFQHFNLMMNKTVYENIAFPLKLEKKSKEEIHNKTIELLAMVGLEDKASSYPSKLSGGQKQRVGIARALAGDPSIIICDEATSALDPATTKSILQLLKEIHAKRKITFIVITHEMDVIKEICTKAAILEDGLIIEEGSVLDLYINPKTETAKKFFNKVDTTFVNATYDKVFEETGVIVKAAFIGDSSVQPYISRMIKKYDVDVSILSGNIEEVSGAIVGCLVLKIDGNEKDVQEAINSLRSQNILLEVIKRDELHRRLL